MTIPTYKQRLEQLKRTSIGGGPQATQEEIRYWNDRYRRTLASLGLALTDVPHNHGDYIQAPIPHPHSVNPWPVPSWIVEAEIVPSLPIRAVLNEHMKAAFIAGMFAGNGYIDNVCCTDPNNPEHVAIREREWAEYLTHGSKENR